MVIFIYHRISITWKYSNTRYFQVFSNRLLLTSSNIDFYNDNGSNAKNSALQFKRCEFYSRIYYIFFLTWWRTRFDELIIWVTQIFYNNISCAALCSYCFFSSNFCFQLVDYGRLWSLEATKLLYYVLIYKYNIIIYYILYSL